MRPSEDGGRGDQSRTSDRQSDLDEPRDRAPCGRGDGRRDGPREHRRLGDLPGAARTRATSEGGPCGTVAPAASSSPGSGAGGRRAAMRSMRWREASAASDPQGAMRAAKAATVGRSADSRASAAAMASSRGAGTSGRSSETGA